MPNSFKDYDIESLHPAAREIISKKFNIVDVIFNTPWRDIEALCFRLSTHQNRSFAPKDRIFIFYCDVDYYPSLDCPGNFLYNLIKLVAHFNISAYHITILSNAIGIDKQIQALCDQNNIDTIRVIETRLWYDYPQKLVPFEHRYDSKDYLFSCLNGVTRPSRQTFHALLIKNNLLDQGLVSYYPSSVSIKDKHIVEDPTQRSKVPFGVSLRTVVNHVAVNSDLDLCREAKRLHLEFQDQLNQEVKSNLITGIPDDPLTRWHVSFLNRSLVYLATETVGQYPYPWFSEKTWKGICSKMPFMIIGPKYSLRTLKGFGFKTFDSWWDESYDSCDNLLDRMNIIINNLKHLQSTNWTELALELKPVTEHNFALVEVLTANELAKLQYE